MPDSVASPPSESLNETVNLGWRCLDHGDSEEALAVARAALAQSADCAAALHLCGEALYRQRRIAEAEAHLARALALGAESDRLVETCWMCAMLAGDFERAWRVSDAVLRRRSGPPPRHLPHHLRWVWNGDPLAGQRLLVRCYHGLGDTLQFIRLVPRLAGIARSVAVEAPPALLALLQDMPGIDTLLPLDAAPPDFDVEAELMELPHALRLTEASLPREVPYLRVPAAHRVAASELMAREARRLKVGVVWAAGAWRPERSVPLDLLVPLDALPRLALVCLQQGPARQAIDAGQGPRFAAAAAATSDILDTAALMMELDLIVTVDTMVAHLAGALGRPVWVMLPFAADWRWQIDRDDSPWYPTMRLFRQKMPGAWEPVVRAVAAQLARIGRRRNRGTGRPSLLFGR